jgi:hypothetical protein
MIEYAHRQGFDNIILAEHHASPDGYCPMPLLVAAGAVARTKDIMITLCALARPRGAGSGQTHHGAFVDNVALELGNGRKNAENQAPIAVAVSTSPVSTLRPTPRLCGSPTSPTTCGSERPIRSSFQTARASPSRATSSACAKPGRSVARPYGGSDPFGTFNGNATPRIVRAELNCKY